MKRYLVRRLMQLPLPLLLITFVVFVLVRSAGDPTLLYLGLEATDEQRQVMRQELGLDKPILVQYGEYLGRLAQGDLGRSIRFREPALDVVLNRLPNTALLAIFGLLTATVVGVILGVISARFRGSWTDVFLVSASVTGQSIPSFWMGILLILVFSVKLRWFPTSGMGGWQHYVLPSVTLASFILPHIVMLTRTAILEVLQEQYIIAARAKGLGEQRVIYGHALRNALNPIIAFFGLQFGQLLGGSVITETIFSWPGVGQITTQSILNRDAPVVVASVLVLAIIILLCNLAADIVNATVDPRIRFE